MTNHSPTTMLARVDRATRRLEQLIDSTPSPTDSSREAVQARAAQRMDRLLRFLEHLDNPHRGYSIVHIGGTSGKGSTSTALAAILTAAGYRTGLHTSPYLQTPLEKLQLNGSLIRPDHYVELVDRILATHDTWIAEGNHPITYGEAWMALTCLFFTSSAVEIAVLEVGAGGRFDLTNIVSPVACAITSVGIDHTNTLGSTIADIAWHKAGIIKPGIPVVTAASNPEAFALIQDTAGRLGAPLTHVTERIWAADALTSQQGTSWTDARTGILHHSSLCGRFQAINGATAIGIAETLRTLGYPILDEAIVDGLLAARIPGRAEIIHDGHVTVMLDGAHNADKVRAIATDIASLLPVEPPGLRVAVLGVLEAKQALDMVATLVDSVDVLVATSPQVTAKASKAAAEVATIATDAGFHGDVWIDPDPTDALERAIAIAAATPGSAVLVTGSLYLVGNVRERWFDAGSIAVSGTSWPGARVG